MGKLEKKVERILPLHSINSPKLPPISSHQLQHQSNRASETLINCTSFLKPAMAQNMVPASFDNLPTDIMKKILEPLSGVDLARLACVSRAFRFLTADNDLWNRKFIEQFGHSTGVQHNVDWKRTYASGWDNKRKIELGTRPFGGLLDVPLVPVVDCPSYFMNQGPYCCCNWCAVLAPGFGPNGLRVPPHQCFCPHCRRLLLHS